MSAGHEIAGSGRMETQIQGGRFPLPPDGSRKQRSAIAFDWMLRWVFGLLLAGIALGTMIAGGAWFASFIAAVTVAGVREWHRMVTGGAFFVYAAVSMLAIAAALAVPLIADSAPPSLPLWILGAAALVNLAAAWARKGRPLWQAAGALYLGVPGIALFGLRAIPDHGIWLVLILFLAIWSADTGALFSGKLIGGPKLAPMLSPNKTWAGFLGGIMLAAVMAAGTMAPLGGNWIRGAAFGAGVALAGHAGDLFESWVKRGAGRKDSGHLIPGHGGVLDRIDSILFAAPVCAAFVFLFGVHTVFGVQP